MKKKFSFFVCLLLAYITAGFAQVNPAPELTLKFSSEDGVEEYWYYINFNRRQNTAWTIDLNYSGEIRSSARVTGNEAQQWKLVGKQEEFYFVNRATGFLVAYTGGAIEGSDLENGKRVPNTGSGDVYFVDGKVKLAEGEFPAAMMRMEWRSENTSYGLVEGWVFLNNGMSGTPYMNDRAGSNVCNYGFLDTGDIILYLLADTKIIGVTERTLSREGLLNNTSSMSLDITSMNITTAITGTVTGTDASAFGFRDGKNTITGRDNAVQQLYITFLPTELDKTYEATLTLSAEGAEDVTIALRGTAFDESELPVLFSSDDASDEHWYYIQFKRKAADNLVWSSSDTTRLVVQDTLKGGAPRHEMLWKVCGDWEQGYYLVNRATGAELLFNTRQDIQPGENAAIFDDVSSVYYVLPPAGEVGNDFEFVRYAGQGATGNTWQLYNRSVSRHLYPNYKYINDSSGRYLVMYTMGDTGCELTFIPTDLVTIVVGETPIAMSAPEGETTTYTLTVGGVTNSSEDVSVSISGASEGVFSVSPATIPATGGEVTISFTAADAKQYVAFLTLKASGAEDVVIKVSGTPVVQAPRISDEENEYWYFFQFTRQSSLVWQGNGDGEIISQVAMQADNQNQHWKIVEAEDGGYYIENREGGYLYYDQDEDGDEAGSGYLNEYGIPVQPITDDEGRYQFQIFRYYEEEQNYGTVNDQGGTPRRLTVWYLSDASGNYMKFIPAETVTFTGIKKPEITIDANDTLISTRYYTLQGIEVKQPTTTGIYIVRNLYASGKVQATKVIIQVR